MMTAAERHDATALIDFWFAPPRSPERFHQRAIWFKADPGFDGEVRRLFLPLHLRAASGKFTDWVLEPEPCLALVLLLDQLPRNLYRGTVQAFASDVMARGTAREVLSRGFDRAFPASWRQFIYLPFEHSEDLGDQELSVALFTTLARDPACTVMLDYAKRHHAIIARFGRFPHRNRVLGRVSSVDEEDFLKQPNSSF